MQAFQTLQNQFMNLPQTLQIVQTQRTQIETLQDQLSNLPNLNSTIEAQQGQIMDWQRKYQVDVDKAYASSGPVATKWIAPKEGDR